jgi:hypothetical protein
MSVTGEDLADIGRLLAYAARPKDLPARTEAYRELVDRYLEDEQFALAADRVAAGTGIALHVDPVAGAVAVADADSPLRMPLAEFRKNTYPHERALLGIVVLSVARVAYPTNDRLDDDQRVAVVSVSGVVDYLNRLIDRLSEAAAADPEDSDDSLIELWRQWVRMRQDRFDAKRVSIKDRLGIVKRTCEYLEEQGLLQRRSDEDGGTFRATHRFRLAVTALVEDSDLYAGLVELIDKSASPAWEADTDGDDGRDDEP